MIIQLDDSLKWVSNTIASDKAIDSPPIKIGDIVWVYDMLSGMKIPLVATKIYDNGEWDGNIAWTWGTA